MGLFVFGDICTSPAGEALFTFTSILGFYEPAHLYADEIRREERLFFCRRTLDPRNALQSLRPSGTLMCGRPDDGPQIFWLLLLLGLCTKPFAM